MTLKQQLAAAIAERPNGSYLAAPNHLHYFKLTDVFQIGDARTETWEVLTPTRKVQTFVRFTSSFNTPLIMSKAAWDAV